MTIQITDLDPNANPDDSDLLVSKKGAEDLSLPIGDLAEHILNQLTAADVLNLIRTVDTDNSGLNASTLQGVNRAFLQNASNLTTGTIPDARFNSTTILGNPTTSSTGSTSYSWNVPTFITGGFRLKIQWGITTYRGNNSTITGVFRQSFASGLATSSQPIVILAPQNIGDSQSNPENLVELDVRLTGTSLSGFTAASVRTRGNNNDLVRANYIAFGRY